MISIDELSKEYDLSKIDFIKIDAEGAEFSVLKGSENIIDKFHPKMILALHPNSIKNFGNSLSEIWDFIISKKYKVIYKTQEMDENTFINQTGLFDVFLI